MTTKHLQEQARALLARLDPQGHRLIRLPRPFMMEVCGMPNSGKTTLINALYDEFKAIGMIATRSPEGADLIPPPRVLPDYNLRTWMYAMANALDLQHNEHLHVVVFDRGPMDFAVRAELFVRDGVFTEDDRRVWQAAAMSRHLLSKFDLHVFLMCDVETALARKFGPDHASRPEAYGKTTNPETMRKLHEAHEAVWNAARDSSAVWIDTSKKSPDEVKGEVLEAALDRFGRRADI